MRAQVYTSGALSCGVLLAFITYLNGMLGEITHPVWASFMIHGIGALIAGGCLFFIPKFSKTKAPLWSYTGGFFGAVVVILSAIAVSSKLGVSGTIALSLLGQILASAIIDHYGFFGLPKRSFSFYKLMEIMTILAGSLCIVVGAR